MVSRTVDTGAPLSISASTRGLADSTPSAQATAAAVAQRARPLGGQVLLGLQVGRPPEIEPATRDRLRDLEQRLRRDRVLREVEVARAVFFGERRQVLDGALGAALAVAGGADLGQPVVAEGALAPVAAARRIVGQRQRRREVAIERQAVEVGRREDCADPPCRGPAAYRAPSSGSRMHHVGAARAAAALSSSARHRPSSACSPSKTTARVERPERARERRAPQADEHLRDARTAAGEVHVGQEPLELERERVRRLQLPGKADARARRRRRARRAAAAPAAAHVVVERIALGARVVGDLLGRGQRERRAIAA